MAERYQFREGTLDPTPAVSICMLAAICFSGLAGGHLAARIAQAQWRVARTWLVGVVFVFGTLSTVGDWMGARFRDEKSLTAEQIAMMRLREKLEEATKSMWFSIFVPLIGAGSSALGGRLGRSSERDARRTNL